MKRVRVVTSGVGCWLVVAASLGWGQDPASTPRALRTLDSHFPFRVAADRAEWTARAAAIRLQVQASLGLWPLPERTPLQAVVHGLVDAGDYTVERVYFESFPGFYVTGSLYRPRSAAAAGERRPGILCPHGHYTNGRFTEFNSTAVGEMLARGEESIADNARSPLQARCAHLARMGCVVFHYDMIGYADSRQIPAAIAHGFAQPRAGTNAADGWSFFSPRAEMHFQSIMGLQTWNSIRALDFLEALPDVDPQRIAVTGSSGGGTQTFMLCAIDPRPAAAFPAVMVSTGMQGGCTCENCCNLRVATGNVELAALYAPRPLGLSAANDWTKTMPEDGFPELQSHYALLGNPGGVFLAPSLSFPHSYNQVARRVMYAWFARHLPIPTANGESLPAVLAGELGENSPFRERPIKFLDSTQMTVWDADHPPPNADPQLEPRLTRLWAEDQQRQLQALRDRHDPRLKQAAQALLVDLADPAGRAAPAWTSAAPATGEVRGWRAGTFGDGWDCADLEVAWLPARGERPAAGGAGQPNPAATRVLVWVVAEQELPADAALFRQAGYDLVVVHCPQARDANQQVANGREGSAAYTFGYNRSSLAKTARLLRHLFEQFPPGSRDEVTLLAQDDAQPAAVLAAAASSRPFARMIIRDQYRLADIDQFTHHHFLPGALWLGDIPGWLQIAQPAELVCIGEVSAELRTLAREQGGNMTIRAVPSLADLISTR